MEKIFHGLKLLELCGCGAYGEVWYCEDISGRRMALKIVSKKKLGPHWERELRGVINYRRLTENASITRWAADDPVDPASPWLRFGLGFVTYGFEDDLSGVIGHGGAIGSEGLLDRRKHLALGFTKNRINPHHPVHLLRDRISKELGLPVRHW